MLLTFACHWNQHLPESLLLYCAMPRWFKKKTNQQSSLTLGTDLTLEGVNVNDERIPSLYLLSVQGMLCSTLIKSHRFA